MLYLGRSPKACLAPADATNHVRENAHHRSSVHMYAPWCALRTLDLMTSRLISGAFGIGEADGWTSLSWLKGLGLKQYEEAFRSNHIDRKLLVTLTSNDLREMGVASVGHRKTLLAAITALVEAGRVAYAGPGLCASGRRQLTVMFVDLVGSTALASRLDPEDMGEVLRGLPERRGRRAGALWGPCGECSGRWRARLLRLARGP